jgi:periplasmic divalent cation tolerance protein
MVTAYITAPREAARELARLLVDERLAACVNLVACDSVYRWEGEVHEDEEVVLFAKTTDEGYEPLESRVVELHPYDVPCVERIDDSDAFDDFAAWRRDAVRPAADGD